MLLNKFCRVELRITNKIKYRTKLTLNALDIVAVMLSRITPPANVPKTPQMIVTPPNNKSALLCQEFQFTRVSFMLL